MDVELEDGEEEELEDQGMNEEDEEEEEEDLEQEDDLQVCIRCLNTLRITHYTGKGGSIRQQRRGTTSSTTTRGMTLCYNQQRITFCAAVGHSTS